MALLAVIGERGTYVTEVLPAVVVLGLGLATTVAPLSATAVGAAPVGQAGVASAVNNDVARVGGLVAVAILPAAAGITGDSYLHPALFLSGFHTAMAVAAAACALGGVVSFLLVRVAPVVRVAPAGRLAPAGRAAPAGRVAPAAPGPPHAAGAFVCGVDGPPLWPDPDRRPATRGTGGRRLGRLRRIVSAPRPAGPRRGNRGASDLDRREGE
jgi:hypothetical protein